MPKEKMQLHPLTYFWGEKFSPVITRQIVSKLDIMHQEQIVTQIIQLKLLMQYAEQAPDEFENTKKYISS